MKLRSALTILMLLAISAHAGAGEEKDFATEGGRLIKEAREFFKGCENRYQGTPGNAAISDKIEKIFAESGRPSGYTRYETPVFAPGNAQLKAGERNIKLYTLHPNSVNVCPLPQRKIDTHIYYVGKGGFDNIDKRKLKGAFCLFDFNCGYNYLDVMPLGAVGCIFIEPNDGEYWSTQGEQKVINFPITVPRFQVSHKDGEYLKKLSSGTEGTGVSVISDPGRWDRRELKNHWVLIEGSDPELKWELVTIHTSYDSMHYCPELPSGAQEAMNLKAFLDLFERYRKNPPPRSVMFLALNSSRQMYTGAAEAAFHIFGPEKEIFFTTCNIPSEGRASWRAMKESEFLLKHYKRLSAGKIAGLLLEKYIASGNIENLKTEVGLGTESAGIRGEDGLLKLWDMLNERKTLLDDYPNAFPEITFVAEKLRKSKPAATQQEIDGIYETLKACTNKALQDNVTNLPELKDKPAGRMMDVPNPFIRFIEIRDKDIRNEILKLHQDKPEGYTKRLSELAKERSTRGQLVSLFNRFGMKKAYKDLTEEQLQIFETYRSIIVKDARYTIKRSKENLARLEEIRRPRSLLKQFTAVLALGFYATFDNDYLGLSRGLTAWPNNFGDSASYVNNNRINKSGKTFLNRVSKLTEPITVETGIKWPLADEGKLLLAPVPRAATQFSMQAVPAFDICSPYDVLGRIMSSGDNFNNLNQKWVAQKIRFMNKLTDAIMRDSRTSTLRPEKEGINTRIASSCELISAIYDGSSPTGSPQTILPDALVVLDFIRHLDRNEAIESSTALRRGILSYRMAMTDKDGRGYLYNGGFNSRFNMEVYGLNKDMEIEYAVDKGQIAAKFKPIWNPTNSFSQDQLIATFRCEKCDLYDIFHPTRLTPVGNPIILRPQGANLDSYGMDGLLVDFKGAASGLGIASIFLPPDIRAKLLFTGSVSLINVKPELNKNDGIGFTARELDRKSIPEIAAYDIAMLNDSRIDTLNKNAVKDILINNLHQKGKTWLNGEKPLSQIRGEGGYSTAFRQKIKSFGSVFSTYPLVTNTRSDMMKAVIFYLAVLIPFSFFLQRLLFNFVRIEAQIACFAGIFITTYMVFHYIHPAFKIAKNPQVVLISFVMIILAGFVSFALKGKFDYHMEAFKQRFSSEEDVSILKLAGTAMLIGVTNMKRRKLRTALTCATIVLITFTMLSFTSVSQAVAPTRNHKGDKAPYNGIFYSKQTWRGLSSATVRLFTEAVGEGCRSLVRGTIANKSIPVFLEGSDKLRDITAILAVEKSEDGWIDNIPVIKGGRFFSDNYAREVIINDVFMRDTLEKEVKPGEKLPDDLYLYINGIKLKVVGLLDSDRMAQMNDLRGCSIAPQEFAEGDKKDNMQDLERMSEVPESTFRSVDPREYVVIPIGLRDMFNVPITSVSIKVEKPQDVWNRVFEFAHYSENKVYFGATDKFRINKKTKDNEKEGDAIYERPGRYYLGSGFETSIGGLSSLIIPLLVSATIIFNTMLGSVYERKKEIGIYNAIGLNPVHIALFFVAEAVVYGILGGVGGYLIGQILAKIINTLNWLPDINMNYSSLTVVYVILFTIIIVVISTIYPSLQAMRTASSSSGRKRPERLSENVLRVKFPYSFTREMAVAVNSYLKEYFDKHNDSSIGDFVATPVSCKRLEDSDNQLLIEIEYDVALAPYDLGVTETVTLRTCYNGEVGAFMVEADTDRKSGQESNWMATNAPFLNEIRKYLLHWRVLSKEGQEAHMEEGLKIFDMQIDSQNV